MKLYEYQAKEIFSEAGIPVPREVLVDITSGKFPEYGDAGFPCVIKAQVLQGGQGKVWAGEDRQIKRGSLLGYR